MEELLKTIFTESGLVYLLFFIIIAGGFFKGIPYIANKFEEVRKDFIEELKEQQQIFRDALNKISEEFLRQVTISNQWHQNHSKKLDEILENVRKNKNIKK